MDTSADITGTLELDGRSLGDVALALVAEDGRTTAVARSAGTSIRWTSAVRSVSENALMQSYAALRPTCVRARDCASSSRSAGRPCTAQQRSRPCATAAYSASLTAPPDGSRARRARGE